MAARTTRFALSLLVAAAFVPQAALAAEQAARPPRRPPPRRKARASACTGCSARATRPACAATRCRRCSAATSAMPTGSATISPTNISPPSAPPAKQDLAALSAIDRDALNETDRLAYDVFKYQTENGLVDLQPDMLALTAVRPINHFSGFHTFYPVFASGRSAAPFRNVEDYDNNVRRHRQFVTGIDRAIGRFRQGLASGVVETKLTIRNVIGQLDTQLAAPPEQSPYAGPLQTFPEAVPEAERARLRAELLAVIRDGIYPAYRRLRDFLQNEYLPHARDGVGLVHMRGGERLYQRRIQDSTTLPLTADEVHDLGLREVARIKGEMDAIRRQTGFAGTLPEFFNFIRTDPPLRAGEPRMAARQLLRDRPPRRRAHPRDFLDHPAQPPRDPRGRGLPRAQRGRRLLPGRHRRRHAARRLLLQCLRSALAPDLGQRDALSPRRRARATISRSCSPPRTRRCPISCASAATPPSSRAGRSTPRRSGTSSAWRPTPISASAASTTRCCARCAWSSIPASTPRVGPASRRSATCSTIAA